MNQIPHTRESKKERHLNGVREGSLRELNLPRSSRASTERPFVKFANPILRERSDESDSSHKGIKKERHLNGVFLFW